MYENERNVCHKKRILKRISVLFMLSPTYLIPNTKKENIPFAPAVIEKIESGKMVIDRSSGKTNKRINSIQGLNDYKLLIIKLLYS